MIPTAYKQEESSLRFTMHRELYEYVNKKKKNPPTEMYSLPPLFIQQLLIYCIVPVTLERLT